MKIGIKLKKLREEKKINQEEVGKLLKMTKQGYAKWEQNLNEPNIDALIILSNFYNISIDELVERTNNFLAPTSQNNEIKNQNIVLTQKEIEMILFFRMISAFEQGQIIGMIKKLANRGQ